MKRFILLAPSLLLLLAVFSSRFSGSDKSPWLVIAVIVFLALLFVFSIASVLFRKTKRLASTWILGTASPIVYTGLVGFLSKNGIIDSLQWLGFR